MWTNSDVDDYRNYVLKNDLRLNKNYKIVCEEVWKFFKEKYGGTEIKWYHRKAYSYGAEIEATLKEFPIIVFPEIKHLIDFNEPIECWSIYMSK